MLFTSLYIESLSPTPGASKSAYGAGYSTWGAPHMPSLSM